METFTLILVYNEGDNPIVETTVQNHDVFIANNDYQAKNNRTDESKKNDTPDLPNRLDATDT